MDQSTSRRFNQEAVNLIGEVCFFWSEIEHAVAVLCYRLMAFHSTLLTRPEVLWVMGMALSHTDIREKIAITKAIAGTAAAPPRLYHEVEKLLNRIDNELRVERNRYVHDQWRFEDASITRVNKGAKIVRPQSRQLKIMMEAEKPLTLADMKAFVQQLKDAHNEVADMANGLADAYERAKPSIESAQRAVWGPES